MTALCIILGTLLALSLKTQRQAVEEGITDRLPALKAEFRATKQQNIDLQKELGQYKARCDELQSKMAEGVRGAKSLEESLQQARMLAGMAAARGSGVIVTLDDSPKLPKEETNPDLLADYQVHDKDILLVVNELFTAGAEAVSVNGQRLVATSSVRCAGAPILVNSVQVQAPFIIRAIGDPEVLENTLRMEGSPVENLFLLEMVDIQRLSNVVVPEYKGSSLFRFARPVKS